MTANVTIVNRALQVIGNRTNVTSGELIAGSTNEAIQANLVYDVLLDWCLAVANWNFARKTVVLVKTKTAGAAPWVATYPAPPWKYEYSLPADYIIARYAADSTAVDSTGAFTGEPVRFVVASGTISAAAAPVLLSNTDAAMLTYTWRVTDPTLWPGVFERFMVACLAKFLNEPLTGDKVQTKMIEHLSVALFTAAEAVNRAEGLLYADTTPEWIQALGIPYPYRRYDEAMPIPPQKEKPDDNRR